MKSRYRKSGWLRKYQGSGFTARFSYRHLRKYRKHSFLCQQLWVGDWGVAVPLCGIIPSTLVRPGASQLNVHGGRLVREHHVGLEWGERIA